MLNFAKSYFTRRRVRRVQVCGKLIALLFAMIQVAPASAQVDDARHLSEEDTIRKMNEQIRELQTKVKELEVKLISISTSATPGTDSSAPASATPTATAPSEMPPSSPPAQQESSGDPAGVKLRMFG